MRKAFRSALVLGLAGAFTIGAVLCCCVRDIAHASISVAKIHACCAAKAPKADTQHKGECAHCTSSLKIAEAAHSFVLTPSLSHIVKVLPAGTAFVPRPCTIKHQTVWVHGPPGFFTSVPLYTQFHQIRI